VDKLFSSILSFVKAGTVRIDSRHLYSLARHIQKHTALLGLAESVETGIPVKRCRGDSIPLLARTFYYYAGVNIENGVGIVTVFLPPNCSYSTISRFVAPILAANNPVLLIVWFFFW
jgi:aldehyde dehydrogenase (NAD+)